MGGETMLEIAFIGLLLLYGACIVGVFRATARRTAGILSAAPFFGWSGYESLVGRVMPAADIRLDWALLLPLTLVLLGTLAFRWRRLG